MENKQISVSAKIDADIFRRFAVFDAFKLKKRWRSPLIFALILCACACVCFVMRGRREGAALLGWVLLGVGLGFPLTYFLSFYVSLSTQCKKMQLEKPRLAYALSLEKNEIRISNDKEATAIPWKKAFAAYRVRGCIYLYAAPQKAYLLPDGCADADDGALWALIMDCMPKGRAIDCLK